MLSALPRLTAQSLAMRPRSRKVFLVAAATAVAVATALGGGVAYVGDRLTGASSLSAGVWGAVGGFVAAVLGVSAVPVARRILISRADARLVDAASPMHPLMKRLMLEAPGTYAHALVTASLAEAAAEVIGADTLLARVGGYYHDVGKIKRPAYFFENIADGDNPHDTTEPSVSALIIRAHVADGLAVADEFDLPLSVRRIILEHHGTSLMRYFYHKAASEDPNIDEEEYRYHSSRPTSREAGLVMLADAVEASVRSIQAPDKARICDMVRDIIAGIEDDDQLELAGFTSEDLERVGETFSRMLVNMLHSRCEYPKVECLPKRGTDADQHSEPSRA